MPFTTSERARAVVAARWSKPENVARRVNRLADHIRQVVESAPGITAEQADRLAALLRPTDGPGL